MTAAGTDSRALLARMASAVNEHDLDGLVACFAEDYANENPVHPQRSFRGRAQVRRNWTHIFGDVPGVRARVLRSAVDGDSLWAEWELSGTLRDGGDFDMRGVFIYGVADGRAQWARMFLEPAERTGGTVGASAGHVAGDSAVENPQVGS